MHRIHAGPALGKGGCSLDVGPTRWRGEGGTNAEKRAMAYRLAFAWNMAEGIPTEALEAGCVRDFYESTHALLDAVATGDLEKIRAAAARVEAADAAHHFDDTHGRAHDCPTCLPPEEAEEPEAAAEPEPPARKPIPASLFPESDEP